MKLLETKDKQTLRDVKAIQDDLGGATVNGVRRTGCKEVNGVRISRDVITLEQWTSIGLSADTWPPVWRGTSETYAIEVDDADPDLERLDLLDETVALIDAAKAKPDKDRTENEKKLAKADIVKDKTK